MSIRNLQFIRQIPVFGARLFEALTDLDKQHQTLAQQVNGNSTGQPAAPPAISSLKVTGQNGLFHLQITDNNPIYRGISYHAEFADNPHFTNPYPVFLGPARQHTIFLGNGKYYWRAASSYDSSPPGNWAYHGGASPQPVLGKGGIGGPNLLPSQGSGTGSPGQGLQGPGTIPFRSDTGTPPSRV